jgi:glycerol kinase
MAKTHILAIDQGTTSTRCIVFDEQGRRVAAAQREFPQSYPSAGWVEHDPEVIWRTVLETGRDAIAQSGLDPVDIRAIGISNQRETTVVWDRETGAPVYPAIVWQDRRTRDACRELDALGLGPTLRAKTGLLLDPYFSATKIAWVLDNVPGARAAAERGALAFGTIDSFLISRLTGGRVHATDVTNAARTLLFDIHACAWDEELCRVFRTPASMLPAVKDNACHFGTTDERCFGAPIPITGVAGDQHAALFGQAAFEPGEAKATYGTGCFLLLNTGERAVLSQNRLLATPAYRLNGRTTYALEGSIFVAGAAIKWLRDGVGVIASASQTHQLATSLADNHGVYMVPAFVGLGAPHWDPDARGAIFGLTLDATAAHLARAALEAVGYQTSDLLDAMAGEGASRPTALRIDGGMAANDWLGQFLADLLQIPVERPAELETTARGAAFLAGLESGLWPDLAAIRACWQSARAFAPAMDDERRTRLLGGWRDAVARVLIKAP